MLDSQRLAIRACHRCCPPVDLEVKFRGSTSGVSRLTWMTPGRQQVTSMPVRSLCQWRSLYIAQSKTPPGPLLQCCAPLKLEDVKFQHRVSDVHLRRQSV